MNQDIVHEKFSSSSNSEKALFLLDWDRVIGNQVIRNQVFKVEVKYGIDGPKGMTHFGIGDHAIVPEKIDECYFYLTYDKPSKSASFLIHVKDPSNTGYDQVRIFVDKQGDSIKSLDSNDVSYAIDTSNIEAHEYSSDGGWKTNDKHNGEGRIVQSKDGFDAFIHIDNVSENFRFAIEQIDHTGYDLKSVRIPNNGFSTNPNFWSDAEMFGDKPSVLKADKYQPDEIVAKQSLDVNLILVGDEWNTELKQANSKLKENDLISENGVVQTALEAAILSSELAQKENVSYDTEDSSTVKLEIPDWVKDNASWWASDAISQSDFVNAIEYLIKQKIIVILDLVESSESTGGSVPDWVKNNASWWVNDQVSDNEFVNAIQYLVQNGIIRVS